MVVTAEIFEEAIIFAVKAHKGQKRKTGNKPYILHPLSVMQLLYQVKESKNIYLLATAAILHDVVEDCFQHLTIEKRIALIAKKFGYQVAALVDELTSIRPPHINKTDYLIDKMQNMSSYALIIKLCDRYDNIKDIKQLPYEKARLYALQTIKIVDNLLQNRKLTKTHKILIDMIRPIAIKFYNS